MAIRITRKSANLLIALLAGLFVCSSGGVAAAADPSLEAIQKLHFVVSVPPPATTEVSKVVGCYSWSTVPADVARQSAGLTVSMIESSPAGMQVTARNWVSGQLADTDKVIAAFAGLTVTTPGGATANFIWETPKRFCDGRDSAVALPRGGSMPLPISMWKTEDRSEQFCARATLSRALDGSLSADITMTSEVRACGRVAPDVLNNVSFAIETPQAPEMELDSDGRSCSENVFIWFATARLTAAGPLPDGWVFDDASLTVDTMGIPGNVGTVSVEGLYVTHPATQDWTSVFGPMNWEVCPGMERDNKPAAVYFYGDAGADGAHPRCFPGVATVTLDGRVKLSGVFHWPCDPPTRPNGSPFVTTRPYAFAAAPSAPRRLFTVEETPVWTSGVLLESTDGGYEWAPRAALPSSPDAPGHFIVELAPLGRGDTLLAQDHIGSPTAAASRIVRSTDLGVTWKTVLDSGGPITADPHDPLTAWVCSHGVVAKTVNGGRSWTRTRGRCSTAVAVSRDGKTLLVPAGRRLFRSGDRGAHWRAAKWKGGHGILGRLTFDQDDPDVALAIDAAGIARSGDGGLTWQRVWQAKSAKSTSRLRAGGEQHEPPGFISSPGRLVAGPFVGSGAQRGWITLASEDQGRHWKALRAVVDRKRPPQFRGAIATPRGILAPALGNTGESPDFWILTRRAKTWSAPSA